MLRKLIKGIVRDYLGYEIVNKKNFGLNITRDIEKIVYGKKTEVIFDVGANLGDTSLDLALSFPQASIYAFEPDAHTFSKLDARVNGHKNIYTYNFGLGDTSGSKDLYVNKASGGNSFLKLSPGITRFASGAWTENIGKTRAEVRTINEFCRDNGINHIDIIKIDTQGFEMPILKGGDQIIQSGFTKVVYIEVLFVDLYASQSYFHEVYQVMLDRGFRLVGLYNSFRKEDLPHYLLWCDALFVSDSII